MIVPGAAAAPGTPPASRGRAVPAAIVGAVAAAVLLVVALSNLDLLTGRATPFFRDLGTTQRPGRALAAELGSASLNPHASFGQPYHGNPNLLLAYPFPCAPRFLGLHLLLHVALGAAGLWLFLRRQVRSEEAALLGALAFGFSGYVLSSTAFLNATTTIAWVPWLLAATEAARRAEGRRLLLPAAGAAAASALLALAGEPALGVLGIACAAAVAATGPAGTRLRSLAVLAGGGLVGALAVAPWLLEVLRSTDFSSRRLRGFSWGEFAAVGFHPARLLETPFPFLFGDPYRLVSGGFWGFAVSQGNPPYLASLSFGVLPLALALLFAASGRRREGGVWIGVGALGLLLSFAPWLPGARAAYEALPFLHVLRYPVKALFPVTLAVAVLAALGADRLLLSESLPRYRDRASWPVLGAAGLLAASAVAMRLSPALPRSLLLRLWDPAWLSDPAVVLAPVLRRLPVQAAAAAALLLLLHALLRRGAAAPVARLLLLGAVVCEGLAAARPHLPRAPSAWFDEAPPIVEAARRIPGRVFERVGKDVDPVRRGLFGRAPTDGPEALALAEALQGWALGGAVHGLSYAWDQDPDGSYTYLDRLARDVVNGRDWQGRMKWLRASGVGSVLASDVPAGVAGLAPVRLEGRAGVPAVLFRLTDPLPGVRRASRVFGSGSVTEAVARFESPGFDPATDAVVAGPPPAGTASATVDPAARARVVAEGPDALEVETDGGLPGLLQVDRSFTPSVTATVNGAPAPVLATQVNLLGVPVPPGPARVAIRLAP